MGDRAAAVRAHHDQADVVLAGVGDDLRKRATDGNVCDRRWVEVRKVLGAELFHPLAAEIEKFLRRRSDGDALRAHRTPILVSIVDHMKAVELGLETFDKLPGVVQRSQGQIGEIRREDDLLEIYRHGSKSPSLARPRRQDIVGVPRTDVNAARVPTPFDSARMADRLELANRPAIPAAA